MQLSIHIISCTQVFIVFTQIYVYISSNNTSSVTLSKCTQVAFKHISKLVNSAIRMSINTTYNILKCNIFELFGYLYTLVVNVYIVVHINCVHGICTQNCVAAHGASTSKRGCRRCLRLSLTFRSQVELSHSCHLGVYESLPRH